jgi:selenocysteine lyase/cysteine desulfurase
LSFKPHFSRFLEADPARLHFAAHSHHLWPDVTFEAQQRCWLDAARLADGKWEALFAGLYPATQRQVAEVLKLSDPTTIAFGPNTHGFLLRLLSCLPQDRPARVLTTDGEFHSFTRQIERLAEAGLVAVERVACEPFVSFAERFTAAAARGGHDLVYFSQVFYNSGYAIEDLRPLVTSVAGEETIVAIDGYHGFLALPTDLSAISDRAFYLSGGYKYAMAGEGAAFLHAPPGYGPRPRDTGWYAAFGALAAGGEAGVAYGRDGTRFLGATFDPVGIYRLNAVLTWLAEIAVDVAAIHAKVQDLQRRFVEGLAGLALTSLHPGLLVVPPDEANRGHFLTFRTESAGEIYRRLWDRQVITDYRGNRLRFGFGLYHDEADVERLCRRLGEVLD